MYWSTYTPKIIKIRVGHVKHCVHFMWNAPGGSAWINCYLRPKKRVIENKYNSLFYILRIKITTIRAQMKKIDLPKICRPNISMSSKDNPVKLIFSIILNHMAHILRGYPIRSAYFDSIDHLPFTLYLYVSHLDLSKLTFPICLAKS